MPTEQITPGDTVVLKSGSPVMTVEKINGQVAVCVWFENFECKKQEITVFALKKSNS